MRDLINDLRREAAICRSAPLGGVRGLLFMTAAKALERFQWQSLTPETAPKEGQFLATTNDFDARGYGEIELLAAPVLPDGRILCVNSSNYTHIKVWRWWMPVPPLPEEEKTP